MSFPPALARLQSHVIVGVALTLFWLIVYLFTVSPTVNFIDSGELITAAYEPGIAHPPGYPLYVLMGYVATHLLWGEVAWRLNALSSFWSALCVGALYFLILSAWSYIQWSRTDRTVPAARRSRGLKTPARPDSAIEPIKMSHAPWELLAAAGAASLLGASASFWSRSAQAKMYSLHFFLVALLFWLALNYRWAYERKDKAATRRWLVALVIVGSLSFTNHLMTNLLLPGTALLIFSGENWARRLRAVAQEWRVIIPSMLPLLLYLYLPLRMAQEPYMNWGSPDSWGDFRRHIGVWQYQAYWLGDIESNFALIQAYASQQWGLLTLPIMAAAIVVNAFLFRLHRPLFMATIVTAIITLFFSIGYSISEIEPYLIPIYMMLIFGLGVGALALPTAFQWVENPSKDRSNTNSERAYITAIVVAVAALAAIVIQYPLQDRSRDNMAPAFVRNVFAELPPDSILITDYWDFYAPTYYLQRIKGERPDITVIDMSLLRYPWYTEQMRMNDPQLLSKSDDLVASFGALQRRWVEGEPLSSVELSRLNDLYTGLLTSFVERNPERRSYVLFSAPCNEPQAPQGCEGNQVAPAFARYPSGLAFELVKPDNRPEPPPLPEYDLRGITTDRIPLDTVAVPVAEYYASTYRRLGRLYQLIDRPEQAQMAEVKAAEILAALPGR